jgi:hypothetical protein
MLAISLRGMPATFGVAVLNVVLVAVVSTPLVYLVIVRC